MTTKSLFSRTDPTEQAFYENLIIDALQTYGHDIQYIPRDVVNEDKLFGEDVASSFTRSYDLEMYIETVDGYEGQDLFRKFGIEIRDESILVVSKTRWEEIVGTPETQTRPFEGDLIYVPLTNSVFEITHVEHEQPFYQIGHLPVYKLSVSLFEYNDENINIDGIDETQLADAYMRLTLDSTGAFVVGEEITQTQTDGIVSGTVSSINGVYLEVANIDSENGEFNLFEPGTNIVSAESSLTRMVVSVDDVDDVGDNVSIEEEADTIIVFDESNPFGED